MVSQKHTEELDFVKTHQPCPDCGSTDALAVNADGSSKCFSCGVFTPTTRDKTTVQKTPISGFIRGACLPITARKINEETCKKYDYRVGSINGKPCHVATFYNMEREVVAQKLRFEDKTFKCIGNPQYFYGQHLFPNGGRKLTVVEGEIDCLTVAQVVGDNKYPVVSLPSGAQNAKNIFKKHINWLNSFEEVILMFDMDKVGQAAVEACSHILPIGKIKVAKLPLKDPNEMLMNNRSKELVSAFWDAKIWRPDDIICGSELYDRLTTTKAFETVPYPFEGLNQKTHGLRKGEIATFCAGSGVGKSQVCKEIAYHILTTTNKKVGYIALEESIERTANSIIGLALNKLLHLEPIAVDDAYTQAYNDTVGSGKFFLYDHWGSMESDNLLNHVRYMAKALDVEYLVIDHLSIIVSALGDGDERRMIDNIMTKLRALVEETKVGLILVSHLKRPNGVGHEDGGRTHLSQLRGSAGIAQLSDICCGLERNQQSEDAANRTTVRVLKNRFSGETGVACQVEYDNNTGRLTECNNIIEEDEAHSF